MKYCLIQVWSILDSFYLFCTRLKCLEQISGNTNVFRVRLTRYKGREVVLSDGTIVKKNDLLIKIHLHNVSLLKEMRACSMKISKKHYSFIKKYKNLYLILRFIYFIIKIMIKLKASLALQHLIKAINV